MELQDKPPAPETIAAEACGAKWSTALQHPTGTESLT